MSRKGNQKSAEMITRLVEVGSSTLAEFLGTPQAQAEEVMREIAHNLARHYGGGMMYFPKDHEFALTKRDLQIYSEMRSGNAAEVARKWGLSDRQVYAINSHVRDSIMRKRQGKLPGFEDDQADAAPERR
jgi:Mor family transcriptional regulator